ncbi:MAG TPA: FlgD immunoglobulin-like domain containing protein [bacterium]|nr:FlgD immunoglobulin-like domain containing protein [bacterium]
MFNFNLSEGDSYYIEVIKYGYQPVDRYAEGYYDTYVNIGQIILQPVGGGMGGFAISGVVKDNNNYPIADAEVRLFKNEVFYDSIITYIDGMFNFNLSEGDSYYIEVIKDGYQPVGRYAEGYYDTYIYIGQIILQPVQGQVTFFTANAYGVGLGHIMVEWNNDTNPEVEWHDIIYEQTDNTEPSFNSPMRISQIPLDTTNYEIMYLPPNTPYKIAVEGYKSDGTYPILVSKSQILFNVLSGNQGGPGGDTNIIIELKELFTNIINPNTIKPLLLFNILNNSNDTVVAKNFNINLPQPVKDIGDTISLYKDSNGDNVIDNTDYLIAEFPFDSLDYNLNIENGVELTPNDTTVLGILLTAKRNIPNSFMFDNQQLSITLNSIEIGPEQKYLSSYSMFTFKIIPKGIVAVFGAGRDDDNDGAIDEDEIDNFDNDNDFNIDEDFTDLRIGRPVNIRILAVDEYGNLSGSYQGNVSVTISSNARLINTSFGNIDGNTVSGMLDMSSFTMGPPFITIEPLEMGVFQCSIFTSDTKIQFTQSDTAEIKVGFADCVQIFIGQNNVSCTELGGYPIELEVSDNQIQVVLQTVDKMGNFVNYTGMGQINYYFDNQNRNNLYSQFGLIDDPNAYLNEFGFVVNNNIVNYTEINFTNGVATILFRPGRIAFIKHNFYVSLNNTYPSISSDIKMLPAEKAKLSVNIVNQVPGIPGDTLFVSVALCDNYGNVLLNDSSTIVNITNLQSGLTLLSAPEKTVRNGIAQFAVTAMTAGDYEATFTSTGVSSCTGIVNFVGSGTPVKLKIEMVGEPRIDNEVTIYVKVTDAGNNVIETDNTTNVNLEVLSGDNAVIYENGNEVTSYTKQVQDGIAIFSVKCKVSAYTELRASATGLYSDVINFVSRPNAAYKYNIGAIPPTQVRNGQIYLSIQAEDEYGNVDSSYRGAISIAIIEENTPKTVYISPDNYNLEEAWLNNGVAPGFAISDNQLEKVTIIVTDKAGFIHSDTKVVEFAAGTPPSITIYLPDNTIYLSEGASDVIVKASVIDNEGDLDTTTVKVILSNPNWTVPKEYIMNDEGVNGDEYAGDNIFSVMLQANDIISPYIGIRVSARDFALQQTIEPMTSLLPYTVEVRNLSAPVIEHYPIQTAILNQPINISAMVFDDNLRNVYLKYQQNPNAAEYEFIMNYEGNNLFTYELPGNLVVYPGFGYSIVAVDNSGNMTTMPMAEKFFVSVPLTGDTSNNPPIIEHTPISQTLVQNDGSVSLFANVYDNDINDYITEVALVYRSASINAPEEIYLFEQISDSVYQFNFSNFTYLINTPGFKYRIRAKDNRGATKYYPSLLNDPILVNVVTTTTIGNPPTISSVNIPSVLIANDTYMVEAEIIDDDNNIGVVELQLQRTLTSTPYKIIMATNGDNIYRALLLTSDVQEPGFLYRIYATDTEGNQTVYPPLTDNPGWVSVIEGGATGSAPSITHTPVMSVLKSDGLTINALVSDADNDLARVYVWLNVPGYGVTLEYDMQKTGDDYSVYISPAELSMPGVEYRIYAVDSAGNRTISPVLINAPNYVEVRGAATGVAPIITHQRIIEATENTDLTIRAKIEDADADEYVNVMIEIRKPELNYPITFGLMPESGTPNYTAGETYSITIPGVEVKGTGFEYRIIAVDKYGLMSSLPSITEKGYWVTIKKANAVGLPPTITYYHQLSNVIEGDSVSISAEITDVDNNLFKAFIGMMRPDLATPLIFEMQAKGNNIYEGIIPGAEVKSPGFAFKIVAVDTAGLRTEEPNAQAEPYFVMVNKGALTGSTPEIIAQKISDLTEGNDAIITAQVTDVDGDLSFIEVEFKTPLNATPSFFTMSETIAGSGSYSVIIPKTMITAPGFNYRIIATDMTGKVAFKPEITTNPYWVNVTKGQVTGNAPVITHNKISDKIENEITVITATVTDADYNLDTNAVFVEIKGFNELIASVYKMINTGGNNYSFTVPKEKVVSPGFTYRIKAVDKTKLEVYNPGIQYDPYFVNVTRKAVTGSAPEIYHSKVDKLIANKNALFTANVYDMDNNLSKVFIEFTRPTDNIPFVRTMIQDTGDKTLYKLELPANEVLEPGLNYRIVAIDTELLKTTNPEIQYAPYYVQVIKETAIGKAPVIKHNRITELLEGDTAAKIEAVITDDDNNLDRNKVIVRIKPINEASNYDIKMYFANDKFTAMIPSTIIKAPGFEYRIIAEDTSKLVANLPEIQYSPYFVSVIKPLAINAVPPVIVHQKVGDTVVGATIRFEAEITDDNLDYAIVRIKPANVATPKELIMINEGNNEYSAILSGKDVVEPGFEYKIIAFDKTGLITEDPAIGLNPYFVKIYVPLTSGAITGVAPEIFHNKLSDIILSEVTTGVELSAIVEDEDNNVGTVKAIIKQVATGNVYELLLTNSGADDYNAIIPKDWLKEPGIEYRIIAQDTEGLNTASPLLQYSPYFVNIVKSVSSGEPPIISHQKLTGEYIENNNIEITAEITDADDTITDAYLTYSYGTTALPKIISMIKVPGTQNTYRAVIKGTDVKTPGFNYRITAKDEMNNITTIPAVNEAAYFVGVKPAVISAGNPPVIYHSKVGAVNEGEAVTISAIIVDNDAANSVSKAEIEIVNAATTIKQTILMTKNGDTYTATLPMTIVRQPGFTYRIKAIDVDGNIALKPEAQYDPYFVEVTKKSTGYPPVIVHSALSDTLEGAVLKINATVTDIDDTIVSVIARVKTLFNNAEYPIPMLKTTDSIYSLTIPAGYIKEPGFEYRIEAIDAAGNKSIKPELIYPAYFVGIKKSVGNPPEISHYSIIEQIEGKDIIIKAIVRDADNNLGKVRVTYSDKSLNVGVVDMKIDSATGEYIGIIPGNKVIAPFIKYRIVAEDTTGLKTTIPDEKYDPYYVNIKGRSVPPTLTHYAVLSSLSNQKIPITAIASDSEGISKVRIYISQTGKIQEAAIYEMIKIAGNNYSFEIPATFVKAPGVFYKIEAININNLITQLPDVDKMYYIAVGSPPEIIHYTLTNVQKGIAQTITAEVRASGNDSIASVNIEVITSKGGKYLLPMTTTDGLNYIGSIPAELVQVPGFAYTITARSVSGELAINPAPPAKPYFVEVSIGSGAPPVISHSPIYEIKEGNNLVIEAEVTDDKTLAAGSVKLLFNTYENLASGKIIPMTNISGSKYSGTISKEAIGSSKAVYYAISVVDSDSNIVSYPVPPEPYVKVVVKPAEVKTVVAVEHTPVDTALAGSNVPVRVNLISGKISSISINYRRPELGSEVFNVKMEEKVDNTTGKKYYVGNIPYKTLDSKGNPVTIVTTPGLCYTIRILSDSVVKVLPEPPAEFYYVSVYGVDVGKAPVIVHNPVIESERKAILIEATVTDEDKDIANVYVSVKQKLTDEASIYKLTEKGNNKYSGPIPASIVKAPGIYYSIVAIDKKGNKTSLPDFSAVPFYINVITSSALEITSIYDGKIVNTSEITISGKVGAEDPVIINGQNINKQSGATTFSAIRTLVSGENEIRISDGIDTKVFKVIYDNTPPQSAKLLYPTKGKEVNSKWVSFNWQVVSDAVSYKLELANNSQFTNKIVVNNIIGDIYDTQLADGIYYWRIIPTDIAGNSLSPESVPVEVFVINTVVPPAPVLSQPANYIVNASMIGNGVTITGELDVTGNLYTIRLYRQVDNDGDGLVDEDPINGFDDDNDGKIDEDGIGNFIPMITVNDTTTGEFTFNNVQLLQGINHFSATAENANGISGKSKEIIIIYDNIPPAPPVITNTNKYLTTNSVKLTGIAEPNSLVSAYKVDGTNYVQVGTSVKADATNGSFEILDITFSGSQITLVAKAVDNAGNASAYSVEMTFNVITEKPAQPTFNYYTYNYGEYLNIFGTAAPFNTIMISIYNDIKAETTNYDYPTYENGAFYASIKLEQGQNIVSVYVSDKAGNISSDSTFVITSGTNKYIVINGLLEYEGNYTKESSITITGNAKGFASIPVMLNGQQLSDITVSSDGTFSKIISLPYQYNGLLFGDTEYSIYRNVFVDTIAPSINSYVKENSIFKDTQIVIKGNAYDIGSGISDILVVVNISDTYIAAYELNTGEWLIEGVILNSGNNQIKVIGIDKLNNKSEISFTITQNSSASNLSFGSITNSTAAMAGAVKAAAPRVYKAKSGEIYLEKGVKKFSSVMKNTLDIYGSAPAGAVIRLKDGSEVISTTTLSQAVENDLLKSIDVSTLSEKEYTVELAAGDNTISYNVYVDKTAPTLVIPEIESPTKEEKITITGQASDNKEFTLMMAINGNDTKEISVNNDGSFTLNIDLTEAEPIVVFVEAVDEAGHTSYLSELMEGINLITFIAQDQFGNYNIERRLVVCDNQPPQIIYLYPGDDPTTLYKNEGFINELTPLVSAKLNGTGSTIDAASISLKINEEAKTEYSYDDIDGLKYHMSSAISEGEDNTIELNVKDSVGNAAPTRKSIFRADVNKPVAGTISVDGKTGEIITNNKYPLISCDVSDQAGSNPTGIADYDLSITFEREEDGLLVVGSQDALHFIAGDEYDRTGKVTYLPIQELEDGSYEIKLVVKDKAGNAYEDEVSNKYKSQRFVLDSKPPVIDVFAMPDGNNLNVYAFIETHNDLASVPILYRYSNGILAETKVMTLNSANSDEIFGDEYDYVFENLTDSDFYVEVKGADRAGNIGVGVAGIKSGLVVASETTVIENIQGAKVIVPAGAMSDNAKITITPATVERKDKVSGAIKRFVMVKNRSGIKLAPSFSSSAADTELEAVGTAYNFNFASSIATGKNVEINISYAAFSNMVNIEKLALYKFNESTNKWDYVAGYKENKVDKNLKVVKAEVNEGGIYGLFTDQTPPSGAALAIRKEDWGSKSLRLFKVSDNGSGIDEQSAVVIVETQNGEQLVLSKKASKIKQAAGIKFGAINSISIDNEGYVYVNLPQDVEFAYGVKNAPSQSGSSSNANDYYVLASLTIADKQGNIFAYAPSFVVTDSATSFLDADSTFNYPNPFPYGRNYGSAANVDNIPAGSTRFTFNVQTGKTTIITIKIYDITGNVVYQMSGAARGDGKGEVIQTFEWDGRNSDGKLVGNGVYIYVVEGVNPLTGETKRVIKKLAVLR